jgi:hypothetical protein
MLLFIREFKALLPWPSAPSKHTDPTFSGQILLRLHAGELLFFLFRNALNL